MSSTIEQTVFTIFDTETTGLNPAAGDRIIEIAALKVRSGRVIDRFETLVNPQRTVSPGAFAVNRISDEMLAGAPRIESVIDSFMAFLENSCVCSYNLPFDLGFLNSELQRCAKPLFGERPAIDILGLARKLLPGLPRHALWAVAGHLQVSASQQHRAMADVEMTREVFARLVDMLAARKVSDFHKLYRLCGVNSRQLQDMLDQKAAEIQRAIDAGAAITIEYLCGSTAALSCRRIVPSQISGSGRNRLVTGHCCLRNEERTFRLDHILEVALA